MNEYINILIIEDDKLYCEMLICVLKRFIPEIDYVENLNQAYDKLKKKKYQFILLDIRLPDGNGLEHYQSLKAIYLESDIILMSSMDYQINEDFWEKDDLRTLLNLMDIKLNLRKIKKLVR